MKKLNEVFKLSESNNVEIEWEEHNGISFFFMPPEGMENFPEDIENLSVDLVWENNVAEFVKELRKVADDLEETAKNVPDGSVVKTYID